MKTNIDVKIKVLKLWLKADNPKSKDYNYKKLCVANESNTIYDFIGETLSKKEFNLLSYDDIKDLYDAMYATSGKRSLKV